MPADLRRDPAEQPRYRVVPAGRAGFSDLQAVFGTRGAAARCQCQRYKLARGESFGRQPVEVRADRLRTQVEGDRGDATGTSGLVAYLDAEPVGWCAVEPRPGYPGLLRAQVPWAGREEDPDDAHVWALTCLVVRVGHRRRGVSRALVAAAVEHARACGARALEAYPMTTTNALTDELHPGLLPVYLDAGFTEVTRPTVRRAVVRTVLAGSR